MLLALAEQRLAGCHALRRPILAPPLTVLLIVAACYANEPISDGQSGFDLQSGRLTAKSPACTAKRLRRPTSMSTFDLRYCCCCC
jgi:hypothetical protein